MFCQSCGMEAASTYKICPSCGGKHFAATRPLGSAGPVQPPFQPPVAPTPVPMANPGVTAMPINAPSPYVQPAPVGPFAPYWRRALAKLVDLSLILGLFVLGAGLLIYLIKDSTQLNLMLGMMLMSSGTSGMALLGALIEMVWWAGLVISWLYSAALESGSHQATLGKRLFGLKVVNEYSQRMTFGRATGRFFAKFLSDLVLFIGYLIPLFNAKHQALHDMVANTYVLHDGGR